MKLLYKFLYFAVGYFWTAGLLGAFILIPTMIVTLFMSAMGMVDFYEATKGTNWLAIGIWLTVEILLTILMIIAEPPR